MEEAAKEIWETPTGTETYVVADGKVLDWLDAKRLEDGKTVEIWVLMKGGGRKNNIKKEKNERNSWNSGSSLEECDIGRREDRGRMREMSRSGNGRIIPCSSKGN